MHRLHCCALLAAMQEEGYSVGPLPCRRRRTYPCKLIDRCSLRRTTPADGGATAETAAARVPAGAVSELVCRTCPKAQSCCRAWRRKVGPAARHDAYVHDGHIALAGLELGNVFVALQPPRGHGMDPYAIYHQPDLPPPHNYYALLPLAAQDVWRADAIVHVGKHGTLEWLPGKGDRPVVGVLPGSVPRRSSPTLSVHPQRPRRSAAQAKRASSRRRHRPPDAALDHRGAGYGEKMAEADATGGRVLPESSCSIHPSCRCCSSRSGT